jgi:hypothetical protein
VEEHDISLVAKNLAWLLGALIVKIAILSIYFDGPTTESILWLRWTISIKNPVLATLLVAIGFLFQIFALSKQSQDQKFRPKLEALLVFDAITALIFSVIGKDGEIVWSLDASIAFILWLAIGIVSTSILFLISKLRFFTRSSDRR